LWLSFPCRSHGMVRRFLAAPPLPPLFFTLLDPLLLVFLYRARGITGDGTFFKQAENLTDDFPLSFGRPSPFWGLARASLPLFDPALLFPPCSEGVVFPGCALSRRSSSAALLSRLFDRMTGVPLFPGIDRCTEVRSRRGTFFLPFSDLLVLLFTAPLSPPPPPSFSSLKAKVTLPPVCVVFSTPSWSGGELSSSRSVIWFSVIPP